MELKKTININGQNWLFIYSKGSNRRSWSIRLVHNFESILIKVVSSSNKEYFYGAEIKLWGLHSTHFCSTIKSMKLRILQLLLNHVKDDY